MVVLNSFSEVWTIRLVYQLIYPFWWRVARGEDPNINHLYGFYTYIYSRCTVTLCCVWCMHYADASSLFNVWSLIWIFDTDWLEQKSNQFQSSKVDSFVMCFLSSSWQQRADCQLVKCGSGLVWAGHWKKSLVSVVSRGEKCGVTANMITALLGRVTPIVPNTGGSAAPQNWWPDAPLKIVKKLIFAKNVRYADMLCWWPAARSKKLRPWPNRVTTALDAAHLWPEFGGGDFNAAATSQIQSRLLKP